MPPSPQPLGALRLRLTAWYAGTFAMILALLGIGLLIAVRNAPSRQIDESLRDATAALIRAARLRESEAMSTTGTVGDAVDALHIPDRRLYLLDVGGSAIRPDSAEEWIRDAARQASQLGLGPVELSHALPGGGTLRLRAEQFLLQSRTPMIAVAVADNAELEIQYPPLIAMFGGAAVVALVLVAAGGSMLARKSTAPVEQSMDRMRRFMADAAHELRTPLTVLRARAEVALHGPPSEISYATALRGIEAESERLGRIVEDLLMLARVDSGERPIERHRVFLDDVALDAADGATTLAHTKGVTIDIAEFEEAPVDGDPQLLRQLIMIILDNAIKFTPPGGRVAVRVFTEDDTAKVTVEDSGCGIPADQLPHVFERFYRGDPARHRGETGVIPTGAGLGLSIAQWIAHGHGATVSIESRVGVGTRVSVELPKGASQAAQS